MTQGMEKLPESLNLGGSLFLNDGTTLFYKVNCLIFLSLPFS